jgi:hypothetical protein
VTTLAQTDTAQADLDPADDSPLWIVADQDAAEIAFTSGLAVIAISDGWTLPNFHDRSVIVALGPGRTAEELGIVGNNVEYLWADITMVELGTVRDRATGGVRRALFINGINLWNLVSDEPYAA